MKPPDLETQRLLLKPLRLEDAPAIQQLFPRWEIVRFLDARVPWPYPADGALAYVRDHALPAMEAGSEWHWSIRPRTEPERLIGLIHLSVGEDDNRGFWLDPVWQGRGLMTEAADRVAAFWFQDLGMDVLRVTKAVDNAASRRVSGGSGMRMVARVERNYVSGRLPSEIWEITRAEWLTRGVRHPS